MNEDLLKIVAAFFTGAMGLIGGILTFVNGRLKEAETSDERYQVYFKTWQWVSVALSLTGVLLFLFFKTYLLGGLVFTATFAINIALFLSLSSPITRKELVSMSLLCGTFAAGVAFAATVSLLEDVMQTQRSLIGIEEKTLELARSASEKSSK